MAWVASAVIAAVSWYTFNVGRVAWRQGNRLGAVGATILALIVFAGCNVALFLVW